MSIFGKKSEGENSGASKGARRYGIGDVIRLLRTLPSDQHADLVVRVIRTTLESVEVHVSDLIQDAANHEQKLGNRIAELRAQMLELTKQIDIHREEASRLEADLAETTGAKERLLFAEQGAQGGTSPSSLRAPGPLAPLPPPSRLKSGAPASL